MDNLSPFLAHFERQGFVVLDGGLATELEFRGHDLKHKLWSARLLIEKPRSIHAVHLAYLQSGADCITSASYQASIPGFKDQGLSTRNAEEYLELSVALACDARDEFWQSLTEHGQRLRPLVAASVGPYGAYLADGSEYVGDYNVDKSELRAFHESRWDVFSRSGADLIACETIPSIAEAEVLLDLLQSTPEQQAWISFSCRDGHRISDGTPIDACAALYQQCSQVAAIGVNCTPPSYIGELIQSLHQAIPEKEIVVYPNSGERYDGHRKIWQGDTDPVDFAVHAPRWFELGARILGGCCRTGPRHVQAMRTALVKKAKIN